MSNGRTLPPMYLFISLSGMVLLHFLAPVYLLIPFPWNATGLIPLALGITLNISADRAFKNAGTTVKPFEVSSALITSGAYRYSRNPMYFGMLMILTGVALLLGTVSPFIIIPIFVITMSRTFIVPEEKMLDERFGNEWKQYKSGVRRWI